MDKLSAAQEFDQKASYSDYAIQVVEKSTGNVVFSWAPGFQVEKLLVDELADRVTARNVGLLKTRKQVAAEVRVALGELLHELKARV